MKLLLLILFIYSAFALYLYLFQEKIIFRPYLAPKKIDIPKEAKVIMIDGLEVGILNRNSDVTVFYFGGNADNALQALSLFEDLPINVATYNYPGYGNSKGKPSQQTLYQSALMLFQKFHTKHNIIVGRSLGTSVAAYVASRTNPISLILVTPFHSIEYLAKMRYPIFPVSFILKHPFPTYRYIQKVKAPIYVLLAQHDTLTPPKSYEALRPFMHNLKEEIVIPDSTHADILEHSRTKEVLRKFILQSVQELSS
ncbi:hypothetical protein NitYY0814_C1395 [Nitratiruptor sp. YY08-14]|nr:hypothetical protein NitYY0810_C1388 [Nitratiruptor sp. YY08-10]BCD64544.1 hypothetical protein NitYY0814_C1395 [Nitratiruptor sp. YY08-14]